MHVQSLLLSSTAQTPNNPRLPVRLYRGLRAAAGQPFDARAFERRFDAHGWPPDWRGGVYAFHHYHSTAHEVLGVARGHARLMLGGPDGHIVEVRAGDALLLPAGTGHCCLHAEADFTVVGAYPAGQRWDILQAPPDAAVVARIAALADPARDPVTGEAF